MPSEPVTMSHSLCLVYTPPDWRNPVFGSPRAPPSVGNLPFSSLLAPGGEVRAASPRLLQKARCPRRRAPSGGQGPLCLCTGQAGKSFFAPTDLNKGSRGLGTSPVRELFLFGLFFGFGGGGV